MVTIIGRKDDMVITGGENVWPEAVEAVLLTHPAVADAGVAGVDDAEWGQRVVAWVVPAHPNDAPTLEQLRAHVGRTLPGFMAPREVVLVDELPRTALGKLRRGLLAPGGRRTEQ